MDKLDSLFKLEAGGAPVEWGVNRFPDGQVQFWMFAPASPICLWASLPDAEAFEVMLQILSCAELEKIQINYLHGARSDKSRAGDRTVCNVASLGLDLIRTLKGSIPCTILSPHCSTSMLDGFEPVFYFPTSILEEYDFVIFPDVSAERRFARSVGNCRSITCVKERDQVSGEIIRHEVPGMPSGQRVLVVDDLCDGGRTFLEVASFIPSPAQCDLYVTHGVFSNNAVPRLLEVFGRIWVTNSLPSAMASEKVTVLDVWG